MIKPALLLTFDVEEIDSASGQTLGPTHRGLAQLLDALAVDGLRATFFITARYAEQMPDDVLRIVSWGHEVACHGLLHSDDYGSMDGAYAARRLTLAKAAIERIASEPISGFRAPRFRPPPHRTLKLAGFDYDSSSHPTIVPFRYFRPLDERDAHAAEGIMIVPVSVTPMHIPISFLWFRLGVGRAKRACLSASRCTGFLNLYFHPWEFDAAGTDPVPVRIPGGGPRLLDRLIAISRWLQTRGFRSMTIQEFIRGGAAG